MILNVSNKPVRLFTHMQRLAVYADRVVDARIRTIDEFEDLYDEFETVGYIRMVIVDPSDPVLVNDIINYVRDGVKVVTLDIEVDCDTSAVTFTPYEV